MVVVMVMGTSTVVLPTVTWLAEWIFGLCASEFFDPLPTLWHVALVCPCGCGATIALNVLPDASPRWRLYESADGPTLSPSVWRTTGCRSHFILRRGGVIWCHGRRPDDVGEIEYGA